jgi:hypothetical protein
MALTTPNNPAAYKAFFKELAEKHSNIRHDDDTRLNFTVVDLQTAMRGFSDDNIRAFTDSLRSKASRKQTIDENNCIMVLIELNGEAEEDLIKIGRKMFTGSFAIVSSPKDDKHVTVDDIKAICYQTGLDIINVLNAFFEKNPTEGKLTGTTDESITIKAHKLHGWRFDFTYTINKTFCVTAANFDELVIPDLSAPVIP